MKFREYGELILRKVFVKEQSKGLSERSPAGNDVTLYARRMLERKNIGILRTDMYGVKLEDRKKKRKLRKQVE